jgi:hypothetical protein
MAKEIDRVVALLWGTRKDQQKRNIIYAGGTLYINENIETSPGPNEVLRFSKIVSHLSGLPKESCQPCTVHELSKVVIFTFPFDGVDCKLTVNESDIVYINPYC